MGPRCVTPRHALEELLTQHASLRAMMDRCDQLADELDAGGDSPQPLMRAVAQLRVAFQAHNVFEEQMLRPILREEDAFGDVRVDHMVSDHVAEHRAIQGRLADGPTAELRASIAQLRDHLDAEERHFLSRRIVREDLVIVEGGG